MVGPARKREAVRHVEGVLEVSERRACRTTRQPRSTQRSRGRKRGKDGALAAELRRISAAHPRAGYRMATALRRRAGMELERQASATAVAAGRAARAQAPGQACAARGTARTAPSD